MDKKEYIEPSLEEVKLDSDVNVMMGSGGSSGGSGGGKGGKKSLTVPTEEEDIYFDPFKTE